MMWSMNATSDPWPVDREHGAPSVPPPVASGPLDDPHGPRAAVSRSVLSLMASEAVAHVLPGGRRL